jgi:predicted TIM-barrel fold metal-dependent hydrolase
MPPRSELRIAGGASGGEFAPVPVIDSHVHLYPPEANRDPSGWAAARGEARWARLATRRRKDGSAVQGFPDIGGLLRAMDEGGVSRAVLLGWYWEKPETCSLQNRFYAECVRRHPDRLTAFAALQPAAGRAATRAEVARARDEGLVGLGELSPHSQGYASDDPVLLDALALAGELKLPINLHVTDPDGRDYPGRVATPLGDFVDLASALPETTFVLAHWGGLLPLRDPAPGKLANVYYDTAASPLLYGPEIWGRFIPAVGADRVLFGSDYPLNLHPGIGHDPEIARLVAEARASGLPATTLAAVLHENATRILGLK